MAILVVIGGPNGSGKTTLTSYLIAKGRIKTDVINPDDIAINKFGSYNFRIKAAKAALEERKSAIENKTDFAFETTFSGNSEINDILKAKEAGYKTILYYIMLRCLPHRITLSGLLSEKLIVVIRSIFRILCADMLKAKKIFYNISTFLMRHICLIMPPTKDPA